MAINLRNLELDECNKEIDYDTRSDGQPVYIAKAPTGAKATDKAWTIWKLSYDTSNQFLRQRVGTDSEGKTKHTWASRTGLDYSV
jgi:hypothetical protein